MTKPTGRPPGALPILRHDRILIQATPVGYLCAGLGEGAAVLRKAFEGAGDETSTPLGKAFGELKSEAIDVSFDPAAAEHDDQYLRRFANLGFNPAEPRNQDGEWTRDGDIMPVQDVVVPPMPPPPVSAGPSALVSTANGPRPETPGERIAGVAGTALFISLVAGGMSPIKAWRMAHAAVAEKDISQGVVPSASDDVQYYRDGNELYLVETGAGGEQDVIYQGTRGADGSFRDDDGNVVVDPGRTPETISADTVAALSAKAAAKRKANAGAQAQVAPIATTDEPKVCPAPVEDTPHGASDRSKDYRSQVSSLPEGWAVFYNGIFFDGCRDPGFVLLEAKGEGYGEIMDAAARYGFVFRGIAEAMDDAAKQSAAAAVGGHVVEWHFADEAVAVYFAVAFARAGFSNIRVIYEPYIPKVERTAKMNGGPDYRLANVPNLFQYSAAITCDCNVLKRDAPRTLL